MAGQPLTSGRSYINNTVLARPKPGLVVSARTGNQTLWSGADQRHEIFPNGLEKLKTDVDRLSIYFPKIELFFILETKSSLSTPASTFLTQLTQYLKYFCVLFIDKIVMSLLENPLYQVAVYNGYLGQNDAQYIKSTIDITLLKNDCMIHENSEIPITIKMVNTSAFILVVSLKQ